MIHRLNEINRREREKLKHEIMLGTDFLNQNDGFQVLVVKKENLLTRLYSCVCKFFGCFVPLGSDVAYLKVRDQT